LNGSKQVPARLDLRQKDSGVWVAEIAGDWSGRSDLPDISVASAVLTTGAAKVLEFDAAGLVRWDSALMVRILALSDLCAKASIEFRDSALPAGLARLLALSRAAPEKRDAVRPPEASSFLQKIGVRGVQAWTGASSMLAFLGEGVVAFLRLMRGRAQFRWSDTLLLIQQCGPEALGIVALISFLIGMILAFVGANALAQFGAAIYTADLVAVATVREMSCIMTGVIICGRTGAAFAAQLGTMKVNQEIEAFQTFGIAPFEFLVLPRMLALIVMMPLLCIFSDLIAIAGGYLVSTLMLDVSPVVYIDRTVRSIRLSAFLLGIFKGGVFGVLVAMTGCLRGMQCGTNAAAVGQATTSAVVTGITSIIVSDGLFAVICSAIQL
jgi:phospholipid/cholesterol/gamma-HCH transport system permease protein